MELIVPRVLWSNADLTSNQTIMTFIQNLHDKGMVSTTTVLPLLSLDPETEKRNLERERGTVFDPDAPKTGPLPADGIGKSVGPDDGRVIREVRDDVDTGRTVSEEGGPAFSGPPGGPSTGNDPRDFGFPDEGGSEGGPAEAAGGGKMVRQGADEVRGSAPERFTRRQVLAEVHGTHD